MSAPSLPHFQAYTGPVWRIFFTNIDPLQPAQSSEGRFHHSNQPALYGSLTAEGCAVALRRYIQDRDPQRQIQCFQASIPNVIDLRQSPDAALGSILWQDLPRPSPTWRISDAARSKDAQGLIYASRSHPDLTHIVLFDWTKHALSTTKSPQLWPAE